MNASEINLLAFNKRGQTYLFLFEDERLPELLEQFVQWAADPELEFSWYDAAVASQKARDLVRGRYAQR